MLCVVVVVDVQPHDQRARIHTLWTLSLTRLILINRPLFLAQKATHSSKIIFQYRTAVAVMRKGKNWKTKEEWTTKKKKNGKGILPMLPPILIVISLFCYCYHPTAMAECECGILREKNNIPMPYQFHSLVLQQYLPKWQNLLRLSLQQHLSLSFSLRRKWCPRVPSDGIQFCVLPATNLYVKDKFALLIGGCLWFYASLACAFSSSYAYWMENG